MVKLRFAVLRCAGDLHKEDLAWKHLFHAWLPRSGYEPTGDATMEVYRRSPVELGWETFDNDCCLPVRPLRRRSVGAVEAARQAGFVN